MDGELLIKQKGESCLCVLLVKAKLEAYLCERRNEKSFLIDDSSTGRRWEGFEHTLHVFINESNAAKILDSSRALAMERLKESKVTNKCVRVWAMGTHCEISAVSDWLNSVGRLRQTFTSDFI